MRNILASFPVLGTVLALVLVAGCSSANGWTKSGVTAAELDRDTSDCLGQARHTSAGRAAPRVVVDHAEYRRCMEDRGYAAAQPSASAPR